MPSPFGREFSKLPVAGIGLLAVALLASGCAGKSPLAFLKPKPAAVKAATASKQTAKSEIVKPVTTPKPAPGIKTAIAGTNKAEVTPLPEPKKDVPKKAEPLSPEQQAIAPLKPSDQLGPGFWIQLAVHFRQEGGEAAWKKLSNRHSSALAGEAHAIKRIDLGARGRFYRVLVGPYEERASAQDKCAKLRQSKVACFLITQYGRVRGAGVAGADKTVAPKPAATAHPSAAVKPRNPATPREAGITATPAFVKPAPKPHSRSANKKLDTPTAQKKRAVDLPFQRKDSIPGPTK